MAKSGFRVMDSDLHTMEPDGLWEKYLERAVQEVRAALHAPRGERARTSRSSRSATLAHRRDVRSARARPSSARTSSERAFARHPHYAVAHARGYDSETHVQAMDIEGIDVAVIYGTRGRQVLMHDDLAARGGGGAGARAQQLDARLLRLQPGAHEVRRAGRLPRSRPGRHGGAPGRAGAGGGGGDRQPQPHQRAARPRSRRSSRCGTTIEELGVPVGFHPTGQSSLRDDIARRYVDQPNGRVIGVAGRNPVELMYGLRQHGRRRRARASPAPALRVSRGHVRVAAVVAVAAGRGVGEVRPRLGDPDLASCRASTSTGSATSPPTPTRRCSSRWWRRWATTASWSRPTIRTPTGLFPHAIEEFVGAEGVSDKTKAKILWDNCARLYNLGGS